MDNHEMISKLDEILELMEDAPSFDIHEERAMHRTARAKLRRLIKTLEVE